MLAPGSGGSCRPGAPSPSAITLAQRTLRVSSSAEARPRSSERVLKGEGHVHRERAWLGGRGLERHQVFHGEEVALVGLWLRGVNVRVVVEEGENVDVLPGEGD